MAAVGGQYTHGRRRPFVVEWRGDPLGRHRASAERTGGGGDGRAGRPLLVAGDALARQRRFGGRFPIPTEQSFDGGFNFCRAAFRTGRFGRGGGWGVDYPDADVNFSIRLSELTRTRVSFDAEKTPHHFVLQLTDDALFRCPFVMMTEPGGLVLEDAEVTRLREYLLKGGFLWADDFWGQAAWASFEQQMRKVLPAEEFPVRTLGADHPMFRMQFPLAAVKQIPSINFWAGSGGGTSEWGSDSVQARGPRIHRPGRAGAGAGHAQHRLRRLVGARGRGPRLLLHLLGPRLRVRDQRPTLRDVALTWH